MAGISRILGIDYGSKRIGLAISDPLGMTAQPLPFVENNKKGIGSLVERIAEYAVKTCVIGLPLNMKGDDSESSLLVKVFAEKLVKRVGLHIHFWDERYSTVAVERLLIESGVRREKRKTIIDSQAAVFILQGYLNQK